jgi:hypothetical protein
MKRSSRMLRSAAVLATIGAMALGGCSAKNSGGNSGGNAGGNAGGTSASAGGDHGKGRIAFMMPDLITPRWDAEDRVVFEQQAK